MASNIFHENENYYVTLNEESTEYLLINKDTQVVEAVDTSLPGIISAAEQSNSYLVYKTWQWIRKQEENNNHVAADAVGLTDLDIN